MMVTPYVPAVVELNVHDAATVALAVMLTGAGHVTVKPVAGLVTGVRATVPTKLNVLVRVIVEVIDEPVVPLGEVALIVKSPTWDTKLAV